MTHKSELGAAGEEVAAKYLEKLKYKILDRNYRKPWGEIDIIALSPPNRRLDFTGQSKTLVFVEVKTVRGKNPRITAEDQMTKSKLIKFKRTAQLYANQYEKMPKNGWRIDVIAINSIEEDWQIRHYENVF